jgi:hypothetical protein
MTAQTQNWRSINGICASHPSFPGRPEIGAVGEKRPVVVGDLGGRGPSGQTWVKRGGWGGERQRILTTAPVQNENRSARLGGLSMYHAT